MKLSASVSRFMPFVLIARRYCSPLSEMMATSPRVATVICSTGSLSPGLWFAFMHSFKQPESETAGHGPVCYSGERQGMRVCDFLQGHQVGVSSFSVQ